MTVRLNKFRLMLALISLVTFLPGCSKDTPEPPTEKVQEQVPEKAAVSAVATEKLGLPRPDQTKNDMNAIDGQVLEVVKSGSFIFILLNRGDKQTWATVPAVDVKVGEEVTLLYASVFNNFHSKALDRTFGELIFSSGIKGKKSARRIASVAQK